LRRGRTQPSGGDAGAISSGQTKSARIDAGDLDVFTIPGKAGGSIVATVGDTSANGFYPLIELFDPAGKRLTYGSGQAGAAVATYNLTSTGTYYVVLRDYYATTSGNYNLTVVSVPGTQDAGGDAGFIPSGTTRNAKITAGDKDVHPFYAVVGDKLVLTTTETGTGTAFYPLVELFDPTGKRLTYASGQTTTGPVTILSAAKSGIYYYVVSDYYASTQGTYSTLLTETKSATKPTVSITASGNATEGGAAGAFTISRTNIRALPLTVKFTVGGTARNGTDYTTIAASVTLPANVGSVTVQVKAVNDTADEPDETVILTLSSGSDYTLDSTKKTATVKVIDNDPAALPRRASGADPAPGALPSAWSALTADDRDDVLAVLA
jgi:hypothetical protein